MKDPSWTPRVRFWFSVADVCSALHLPHYWAILRACEAIPAGSIGHGRG